MPNVRHATDTGVNRRDAFALAAASVAALGTMALSSGGQPAEAHAEEDEGHAASPAMLAYQHYRTGGPDVESYAVVLFEHAGSKFTKYQLTLVSCTCRDTPFNFRSVMYVEMSNNAASADEAKLRWVTFGEESGYRVGLWGDSNPIPTNPDYTEEYMDEHLVKPLVGLTKADFDAWEGYGTLPADLDVDALTGATVTCSNVVSAIQALFAYHAEKYYGA